MTEIEELEAEKKKLQEEYKAEMLKAEIREMKLKKNFIYRFFKDKGVL